MILLDTEDNPKEKHSNVPTRLHRETQSDIHRKTHPASTPVLLIQADLHRHIWTEEEKRPISAFSEHTRKLQKKHLTQKDPHRHYPDVLMESDIPSKRAR